MTTALSRRKALGLFGAVAALVTARPALGASSPPFQREAIQSTPDRFPKGWRPPEADTERIDLEYFQRNIDWLRADVDRWPVNLIELRGKWPTRRSPHRVPPLRPGWQRPPTWVFLWAWTIFDHQVEDELRDEFTPGELELYRLAAEYRVTGAAREGG